MTNSKIGSQFVMKTKNYVEFRSPYGSNSNVVEHIVEVEVAQLNKELGLWMDTNPRTYNSDTDVSKGILSSLQKKDNLLHILSNGMLFSAESVDYNKSTNVLTMSFTNSSIHGNLDGGHLLRTCLSANSLGCVASPQYVRLTVITGITNQQELTHLAKTRNTSIAVTGVSLHNYNHDFDEIKDVIGSIYFNGKSLLDDTACRQNEQKTKKLKLQRMLGLMVAFDPMHDAEAKTSMFSKLARQGDAAMRIFVNNGDNKIQDHTENEAKVLRRQRVAAMENVFIDIISLHDYIEASIFNRKIISASTYRKLVNMTKPKDKPYACTTYKKLQVPHNISPLIVFMLVCSLSHLVITKENGKCAWENTNDITKVWDKVGESVLKELLDCVEYSHNDLMHTRDCKTILSRLNTAASCALERKPVKIA